MWSETNNSYLAAQRRVADVAGGLGGLSKVLRMLLQSAVLGIGAWLVINQQATVGIIIASSILTSRALAPVELAIVHWRGFVSARQSWRHLGELMAKIPAEPSRMALPKPTRSLSLEAVSVVPPGTNRIVVQDVALQPKAARGWARTSATRRRTWSCSQDPWRRTSRGSNPPRSPKRSSPRPWPQASTS